MSGIYKFNFKFFLLLFLLFAFGIGFYYYLKQYFAPNNNSIAKTSTLSKKANTKKRPQFLLPKVAFQTINIKNVLVDIYYPQDSAFKDTFTGTMLALPGWNFPRNDWHLKSSLFKEALKRGYIVVAPEMGKSCYTTEFYPETRLDWKGFPDRNWVTKPLFDSLQKVGLLTPIAAYNTRNFVVGLSTGARGAVLVAQSKPDVFTGLAALSGDYVPELILNDNVLTGFYGSFTQFKNRWMNKDNANAYPHLLQCDVYLGHGSLDKIVPVSQTTVFYETLTKKRPHLRKKMNINPKAAHDYSYWDSEVIPLWDFLEKKSS